MLTFGVGLFAGAIASFFVVLTALQVLETIKWVFLAMLLSIVVGLAGIAVTILGAFFMQRSSRTLRAFVVGAGLGIAGIGTICSGMGLR